MKDNLQDLCTVCIDRYEKLNWSRGRIISGCRTCNKDRRKAQLERLGYKLL